MTTERRGVPGPDNAALGHPETRRLLARHRRRASLFVLTGVSSLALFLIISSTVSDDTREAISLLLAALALVAVVALLGGAYLLTLVGSQIRRKLTRYPWVSWSDCYLVRTTGSWRRSAVIVKPEGQTGERFMYLTMAPFNVIENLRNRATSPPSIEPFLIAGDPNEKAVATTHDFMDFYLVKPLPEHFVNAPELKPLLTPHGHPPSRH